MATFTAIVGGAAMPVIGWALPAAWMAVSFGLIAAEQQVYGAAAQGVGGDELGGNPFAWLLNASYAAAASFMVAFYSGVVQTLGVTLFGVVLFKILARDYAHPRRLLRNLIPPVAALVTIQMLAANDRIAHGKPWQVVTLFASPLLVFHVFRQVQRDLTRNRKRLMESQALYRVLAENQSDVISLVDAGGKRLFISPSVERVYGFTAEEMMALPTLSRIVPEDLPVVSEAVRMLDARGEAVTLEGRVLHKDGSTVWVEATYRRVSDGSGALLSTSRDITERKRLQEDLVGALDQANAALTAKTDFLANMTHELRTPLNAIIGFSGLLKDAPDLSPRHAGQVALIWDASRSLLGVVNDVLDFAKLEAGAVELEAAAFDPELMVRSTVSMLAGEAEAKGLALSVDAEGLDAALLGDGARLRQVLTNFLSNAIKFTARGGVDIRASQTTDGGVRRLRVAVTDSGIGLPPDQIGAVFGRFTQADASVSRRFGGTGLGLAISKRLIEAMGGEIGAESSLGQGSTFWFEVDLPVAQAPEAGEAAPAGEPRASRPAEMDQALRLLVVEDNAVNRQLICTLLEPFDLQIETAGDGVEAIEALTRASFDLVLMDVQMPNMDGLTATARIRAAAQPGERRIPIIAMTANVLPDQIARCLDAGMDDHIGKPIDPAKLFEALERWSPGADEAEVDERLAG